MATHLASSKWWGGIGQCAGGGGRVEAKFQNRAASAQFWPTQCRVVHFRVEEILLGKHTLGLRWWGGAIGQCARRAELEPQSKTSCWGSVLAKEMWGGGSFSGRGIPFGRHTLGLRWWGGAIRQYVRGG